MTTKRVNTATRPRRTTGILVALGIATTVVTGVADVAVAADPTADCVPAPPSAHNAGVALTVYSRGRAMNVSSRVMLAGFEAAWVESHVNNCRNGDLDSMGVFQQRASWGSADQRTTVAWAADAFFVRAVNAARAYPSETAGQIAQRVQVSAHPARYDQAQATAQRILDQAASAYTGPGAPESVVNGGGTRMVGPGAYLDVSSSGQVYAWNTGYFGGSPAGYGGRFVDAKATPSRGGYWLLTSVGQIYAYGNAPYAGGGAAGRTGDVVALAAAPDGRGYAMVSESGQVYAYGSARFLGGSPGGYAGRFVDIEMSPSGNGYYLLTSAGQVYAYGDAVYRGGSPQGYSRAVVAMSLTASGNGYVMTSKTGQVYAYGDARYLGGSPAGINGEITDVSHTSNSGYVLVSRTGQHYAYGDAPFLGNPSGTAAIF